MTHDLIPWSTLNPSLRCGHSQSSPAFARSVGTWPYKTRFWTILARTHYLESWGREGICYSKMDSLLWRSSISSRGVRKVRRVSTANSKWLGKYVPKHPEFGRQYFQRSLTCYYPWTSFTGPRGELQQDDVGLFLIDELPHSCFLLDLATAKPWAQAMERTYLSDLPVGYGGWRGFLHWNRVGWKWVYFLYEFMTTLGIFSNVDWQHVKTHVLWKKSQCMVHNLANTSAIQARPCRVRETPEEMAVRVVASCK